MNWREWATIIDSAGGPDYKSVAATAPWAAEFRKVMANTWRTFFLNPRFERRWALARDQQSTGLRQQNDNPGIVGRAPERQTYLFRAISMLQPPSGNG
ncbi:MAG: hypothetical protein IPO77_22665 [Acidobacteria bacterium]|nr:hypothetical protein [Acidobacteriota bacterium]